MWTYKQRSSWLPGSRDLDLKILPRLLNVESLGLAECAVTEQGLASLRGLDDLRSLNLARLNHLRYGSPETATERRLSDTDPGPEPASDP